MKPTNIARRVALALALLIGCAGGPVPVFWIDGRIEDDPAFIPGDEPPEIGAFDRIADACAFWDLDCFETDDASDVLTIWLVTHGGPSSDGNYLCGETVHPDPCAPFIVSCGGDRILEHEIGHAFGLRHTRTRDNVMHENNDESTYDATDRQHEIVARAAARLSRCGGGL